MSRSLLLPLLGGLCLSGPAQAEAPHVHGQGTLQLIRDGQALLVELTVPAMDVVGFEVLPADGGAAGRVEDAAQRLRDPASLLALPAAAGCEARSTEVHSALLEQAAAGRGHGHADHDHGHHHNHGHHHDHDHAHQHADFHVSHEFECAQPAQLRSLTVTLFETLPGLERLIVQSVGDTGAREARLQRGGGQPVELP